MAVRIINSLIFFLSTTLVGFVFAVWQQVGAVEILRFFLLSLGLGVLATYIAFHLTKEPKEKFLGARFSLFNFLTAGAVAIFNTFLLAYVVIFQNGNPISSLDFVTGALMLSFPFLVILWVTYVATRMFKPDIYKSLIYGLFVAAFTFPLFVGVARDFLDLLFVNR